MRSFTKHGSTLFTHVVDPADVGADSGEDRRLLGVVAAGAGAEADDTVDGPGAIRVLAVQGTTGVSLQGNVDGYLHEPNLSVTRTLFVCLFVTHVAASQHSVTSSTDHVVGDQGAPPVGPCAGAHANHGQAGLLQDVSNGTSSFGREDIHI